MYGGKYCVEKFLEHNEDEIKQLHATFLQQIMRKLTNVLTREHEAAEKCHICFKEFNDPEKR